jgi:hypothetical protein
MREVVHGVQSSAQRVVEALEIRKTRMKGGNSRMAKKAAKKAAKKTAKKR